MGRLILRSVMNIKDLINKLLPVDRLSMMSGEEIVEHIALHIYKDHFSDIREHFEQLPEVLRDIVLVIDLDTELNMNGITGYLENSSGCYFEETMETLERIQFREDLNIMKNIKAILMTNGISLQKLRENRSSLAEYQISNFLETHGRTISDVMDLIETEAEQLYLYHEENNIFEYLFKYVEANKDK
ncbi:MAG: DMP19 family protein [Bacillota bacterium]